MKDPLADDLGQSVRPNPKYQYRNPKQISISKSQVSPSCKVLVICSLGALYWFGISCFGFGICPSNFGASPKVSGFPRSAIRFRRPSARRCAGIVLILVMVMIAMLTLAGLSFVLSLGTEHKAVDVHGDELRLQQVLESGVEMLSVFAQQTPELQQAAGGADDNPDLFQGVEVLSDDLAARHGRVTVLSPRVENDEITGVRYGWEDESGRLNLGVLPDWERQMPGSAKRALMALPGMTETVADKILDWISIHSSSSARDVYGDLHLPYAARNGCPARLQELLLIPDVPRDLLLGHDLNYNYRPGPRENGDQAEPMGGQFGGDSLPWRSLLTLYSAERNIDPRGQPRIALNDPDLHGLFARLSQVADPSWAKYIVLYRQYGPAPAGSAAPGGGPPVSSGQRADEAAVGLDFSRPGTFQIASILDLIGTPVLNPSGQPPIVISPFSSDRQAMQKYLPVLLDETSLTAAKTIRGRVNLNTAPRAVLRGVPGMDDRLVESIVTNRRAAGQDVERRYPIWLLTEGLVGLPQMKTLLPYLTCGGQVYRAQVVAYFEEGGPVARAEIVLDATLTPPAPVAWTDLRVRGRGFSADQL